MRETLFWGYSTMHLLSLFLYVCLCCLKHNVFILTDGHVSPQLLYCEFNGKMFPVYAPQVRCAHLKMHYSTVCCPCPI